MSSVSPDHTSCSVTPVPNTLPQVIATSTSSLQELRTRALGGLGYPLVTLSRQHLQAFPLQGTGLVRSNAIPESRRFWNSFWSMLTHLMVLGGSCQWQENRMLYLKERKFFSTLAPS